MDFSAGVSVGQLVLSMAGVLIAGGVTWGGLLQRVKTLEREVAALAGFAERLTRIEEQTGYANRKLDAITSSWLFREPPAYEVEPMGRKPRRPQD